MMRNKPFTSMQKTYDECYLICSTAIYFERQNNEAEALRSWRSALNQIYHHNAYLVPVGYTAKTETERALQESLREMELQCKERVDVLDALERSRKDAEKESKKMAKELAKEEKAALRRGDRNASTATIPTMANQTNGWIGYGTVPPVSYEDLSRPPPLPSRPSYVSTKGSPENASKQRTNSLGQIKSSPSSLPAPPTLPVPAKKGSRSPSPDQRKTTMLTTLRKGDGKAKSSRTASRKPPAASKAAGLAWDTKPRPSSQTASIQRPKSSQDGPIHPQGATRKSLDDVRPLSDDEYRRSTNVYSPSPSDHLPSSSWREPQAPVAASAGMVDDHLRQLNLAEDISRQENYANEIPTSDPFDPMPPPPPPHGMSPRSSGKPQPPPPRKSKPPELSYRQEYPPATLKPGATSIGVKGRSNAASSGELTSEYGSEPVTRKPIANSSTPRTDRTRPSNTYISTSSGSEDNIKSRAKPSPSPRRRAVRQNSKQKGAAQPTTPPSSDESESLPESSSTIAQREWEQRTKAIMKDLPRGVDEATARQILNEIVVKGDEVHWSDIAGLEIAKKALKEAVVYPFLRPDLFMGLREPARGMLLFGPPGTGKTMLARAVATESRSTFFAISAGSLTSKWHGESEKLVRALFALAKKLAPSIIFVDEIDSLLSARSSSSEHEASRRSKTEFLIQWSDLQRAAAGRDTKKEDKDGDPTRVLVLAATNCPWDIDEAARRRFVRRQYIPLPEAETRAIQVRTLLSHQKHDLTEEDIEVLVQVTEGFSGSDITSLAKDAAMGPLRNLGEALLYTPMDQIRSICFTDFEASLVNIRPSVGRDGLKMFEEWSKDFGERGG